MFSSLSLNKLLLVLLRVGSDVMTELMGYAGLHTIESEQDAYTFLRAFLALESIIGPQGTLVMKEKQRELIPEGMSFYFYREHNKSSWREETDFSKLNLTPDVPGLFEGSAALIFVHRDKNQLVLLYNTAHHSGS
jgi:hypothetical protein